MQDIITFGNTGLNYDDDLLALPVGDSRYRLNIVTINDGNHQVLVNTKSNVYYDANIPAGTNKIIGYVEDPESRSGVYALYNSSGNHSFIEYFIDTDTTAYLLDGTQGSSPEVGDILNFQSDRYVDMQIIGNGDDRYLVWTDGFNPPRIGNMLLMRNYTNLGSPAYTEINEDIISFYKKPYAGNFTLSYISVASKVNNVRGKVFQFAVRLKYIDNTYSVLSHFSQIALPEDEETGNGIFTSVDYANNAIRVTFPYDANDEMISEYQLCYRIVDQGSGVPSNWYVSGQQFGEIGGQINLDFTNSSVDMVLSSEDSSRVYDFVPDLANCLYVIDSNRVVFGGITEGFDNIAEADLDVTLTHSRTALGTGGVVVSLTDEQTIADTASFDFNMAKLSIDDYYYSLYIGSASDLFEITTTYGMTGAEVATYFQPLVNALTNITASVVNTDDLRITNSTGGNLIVVLYVLEPYTYQYSFKSGSKQYFGLQYMKDGKVGSVQKSSDFAVDIPYIYEASPTYGWTNFYNEVSWTIAHEAPSWATHYQWVYLGSDISYYEHYLVWKDDDLVFDGNYLKIKKAIATQFRGAYNDAVEYGFDYQKGDRVRFIGLFQAFTETTFPLDGIEIFDELYDYEILYVDSTYIYIKNVGEDFIDGLTTNGLFPFNIEIYQTTKVSEDSGIYQAVSPLFGVYESSGSYYHRGGTQDQTAVLDATGDFTPYFGNAIMRRQAYITVNNFSDYTLKAYCSGWTEGYSISLLYDSAVEEFGKPNVVNPFSKEAYFNKIVFGGKFLDNSGINYMTRFDYDDRRDLDDKYGEIIRLHQFGSTLRVFQERKVTSFQLGGVTSVDATGNMIVSSSDQVMDVYGRQFIDEVGCTHFASFASTIRTEYFYDVNNAAVVRASSNGMEIISEYKMHSFFEALTKRIVSDATLANVRISAGFNDEFDMYMITFYDTRGTNNDDINYTVGFHETTNRWVSFYGYYPEFYGPLMGKYNLSFIDGETYLDFNGSTYENAIVYVHSNQQPNEIKVFESIAINSTEQWYPDEDGDIEVTLPIQKLSRLKPGKFRLQEGEYRSEFLRDMLSGYSTVQENNLFNGWALRGYSIKVILRYEGTDKAVLRLVKIDSTTSL